MRYTMTVWAGRGGYPSVFHNMTGSACRFYRRDLRARNRRLRRADYPQQYSWEIKKETTKNEII